MSKFWLVYHGTKSVNTDNGRIPCESAEIYDNEINANLRKIEIQKVHLENDIHDGYVYLNEATLGEKHSIDYVRLYL